MVVRRSLRTHFANHHPLSENRDFSTTEHLVDLRPACKLEFVRTGPVEEKKQSPLSVLVQLRRSDKARGCLFPKKHIHRFVTKLPIFQIALREQV